MKLVDRITVGRWLRVGATLAEVEAASSYGLVDNERFTERAVQVYRWLWIWSGPRMGGIAGAKQERVWARRGPNALARRHARALRIAERLRQEYVK